MPWQVDGVPVRCWPDSILSERIAQNNAVVSTLSAAWVGRRGEDYSGCLDGNACVERVVPPINLCNDPVEEFTVDLLGVGLRMDQKLGCLLRHSGLRDPCKVPLVILHGEMQEADGVWELPDLQEGLHRWPQELVQVLLGHRAYRPPEG